MANILRKMKNDRKNTIMLRDITLELNFTGGIDSSFPIHKCLELKFILKLFRATNVKISKSPKNKTNQDM